MTEPSRRDQFIESVKHQLDELNDRIKELEKRAHEASAQFQERHKDKIDDLKEKRGHLEARLSELRKTSEGEFERVRGEVEHAWKALKSSYNYFKSQF